MPSEATRGFALLPETVAGLHVVAFACLMLHRLVTVVARAPNGPLGKRKEGPMQGHVVFIQGAGRGAYDEDRRLAESLRRRLGPRFEVRYPAMPNEDDASYEPWRRQIEQELAAVPRPMMLVGHSVGASVLVKWLSERKDEKAIAGVFLVACPFWGGDGWRYEGYEKLALPPGFAAELPTGMPVYLYHCRDDATVPFDHLALYAQALPRATVRAFDEGGHQFNDDLSAVARDIQSLPSNPLNGM